MTDPRAIPSDRPGLRPGRRATSPGRCNCSARSTRSAASKGLASLAAFGGTSETRRVATETLRGRDAREYADLLIGQLRDRIKYEVEPVAGPGSPGRLRVEGKRAIVDRVYIPRSYPA